MPSERVNNYEGLFLFPQAAASNLQTASDHVKSLLERVDAEIISMRKWDERRLAYEIKGNKRGVYFLVYFSVDRSKLNDLDRACNLSEQLLRVMITRADHLPLEQMQAVDGQAELADEIRLRGDEDQRSDAPATPAAVGAGAGDEKADENGPTESA
jgi:small subunit ribosomal protein S6